MVDVRATLSKKPVIAGIVAIIIAAIIIISIGVSQKGKLPIAPSDRIECPGFASQSECEKHGCRYQKVSYGPECFMTKEDFGYNIVNEMDILDGITTLKPKQEDTPYGKSLPNPVFDVSYLTENIVRIKILDGGIPRYHVPVSKTFPLLQEDPPKNLNNKVYEVIETNETGTFFFQVRRKSDNTVLFDSSIGGLILSDQFLQISGYVPSSNIYGLGENVHKSFKHDMNYRTWPLFSRDRPIVEGQLNHYGVHPYYTCLEQSSKSHGVLFLNSNAMDVTLMPAPAITFRTTGGIIEMFFFVGDDPEHVSRLYTSLIGRPQLPPFWSLGFQLSRYGYKNLDEVKKVVERTRAAQIPQEVQFLDIDHMNMSHDFTYDEKQFAGLPDYIRKTKSEYGLKWIIILDPAIARVKDYKPFSSGLAKNIFIKRPAQWDTSMFPAEGQQDNVTYGRVWPSEIAGFPDFFLDSTKKWWQENIVSHHKTIEFDGLWIDMNEPSNFGTNEKRPFYCGTSDTCWSLQCPHSAIEDPPYNPVSDGNDRISAKTLCMESIQGTDAEPYLHYDVHSIYGWAQTEPTLTAAETATGRRSLVISRSTYPSSGRHTGHWLGDNRSTYQDMRSTVIGIMEFNLFGIPYIGADVCGFFKDTTDELCARWMQLGAFYPFYRNHNGMAQKDQDPGALSDWAKDASRRAVLRRYSLRSHLYTLFYRAHIDGSTVIRPLHHEFPGDKKTWDIDTQFMWGANLLITPVLTEGSREVSVYLPKAEWWHFKYEDSDRMDVSETTVVLPAGEKDDIPLHVRGGSIIPIDNYEFGKYNETAGRNFSLYVFQTTEGDAAGEMFIDDGFSKDTLQKLYKFVWYEFKVYNCTLYMKPLAGDYAYDPAPFLDTINVFKVINWTKNSPDVVYPKTTKMHLKISVNRKLSGEKQVTWFGSNVCTPKE